MKNTDISLQKHISAELYAAEDVNLENGTVSIPRLPFSHIVCIKQGEIVYKNEKKANETKLSENTFLIIPPGVAHSFSAEGRAQIISIFAVFSIYGGFDLLSFYSLPEFFSPKGELFDMAQSLCDMMRENLFTTLHTENAVLINSLAYRLLFLILSRGTLPTGKMQLLERLASFEDIISYINQNLTDALPQKELSKMADMSVDVFYKAFRSYFSMAPKDYILTLRLQRAATELFMSKKTVVEISAAAGYDNSLYFSSLFKKKFGLCPTDYRKKLTSLY